MEKTLFVLTGCNVNSIWDGRGSQPYVLSKHRVYILMNYGHLHVKDNCAKHCYMVGCLVKNTLQAAAFFLFFFLLCFFLLKQNSRQTEKTRTKIIQSYALLLICANVTYDTHGDEAIPCTRPRSHKSDGTIPGVPLPKVDHIQLFILSLR